MCKKVVAEIIGTFIFLSVIIFVVNGSKDGNMNWFKIGLALGVMILLFGNISGGHFNPAVSFMFYMNNQLSMNELGTYWVGQFIGAILAFMLFKYYQPEIMKKN